MKNKIGEIYNWLNFIENNAVRDVETTLFLLAKNFSIDVKSINQTMIKWFGITMRQYLVSSDKKHLQKRLNILNDSLFDINTTQNKIVFSDTITLHSLHLRSISCLSYDFYATKLGDILIGSCGDYICYLSFVYSERAALKEMKCNFPSITMYQKKELIHTRVCVYFSCYKSYPKLKLGGLGTPFQIKVWEQLLTIPYGALSTYGAIAKKLHQHKAYRAVGTAAGQNKIAFLIPCHRVIQQSGQLGGYRWGIKQKKLILAWESSCL